MYASRAELQQRTNRLLKDASVCSRITELKQLVCNNTTQRFLELAITERDQRLTAIQDRWNSLREAIDARAAGDYKRMMATGVVCMKLKSVRGKNNVQRVYREYEIDTGVIEALNSVEKRAAIETGQEQENIQVTGQVTSKAIAVSKVMTIPELEELERKMLAAMEAEKDAGKVVEAPKAVQENKPKEPRTGDAEAKPLSSLLIVALSSRMAPRERRHATSLIPFEVPLNFLPSVSLVGIREDGNTSWKHSAERIHWLN